MLPIFQSGVRSPNGEILVTALLTEKLCFQSGKYYGSSDSDAYGGLRLRR
ncbi:hypothetical protein [Nostoc sp. 'Peltigera membranacea cyanobiont' 210A]|nr:hypothetical protein [Nostoc sp. 'Peltigera membranacea cyanobiont' 210A]